jgi:hypothetical protein
MVQTQNIPARLREFQFAFVAPIRPTRRRRKEDSNHWSHYDGDAIQKTEETQIGFGRRSKGLQCHATPRAAAKSSHKQVGGRRRAQRAKPGPGRACSRPGHRQNPTGTIRGMSKRSPEPCRHGGTAPYPRGTDPGARRQTLCDTDRNGAGTRDSLTRVVGRSPESQFAIDSPLEETGFEPLVPRRDCA